jgi:hypothetical protein
MKKISKRITSIIIITVMMVVFLAPTASYAATSLDKCTRKIAGWSVSVAKTSGNKIGSCETLSVTTNRTQNNMPSTFTKKLTYSATFGGDLSSSLSASIAAGTGKVNGGLGAEVNGTVSFSGTVAKEYTEKNSLTIQPNYKLTVTRQNYGDKITGYGKFFVAWVTTKSGSLTINIPKYDDVVYKTTKI